METLLYDNFRKSIYKFWISYINTISLPSELNLKITLPLSKEGNSFLSFIIQAHLNTPWYRNLKLSAPIIQSEQLCFSIKGNTIKQAPTNGPSESLFTRKSLQFLKQHYPSLEKVSHTFLPLEQLLYTNNNTVIGLIGFYTYDPKQDTYWFFLYNLNTNKEYKQEEKVKYYSHPNIDLFRVKYETIPFNQARIPLQSFAKSINMFSNVLVSKLKEHGNCTLNEYHWYNRMLEALHLHLFDPKYKNKTAVAHAIGYESLNSFYKAFIRFFLISPKDIICYK